MPQDKVAGIDKPIIRNIPNNGDVDVEMNAGEQYFFNQPRKFVGYSEDSASLFLYIIIFIAVVVLTMVLLRYLLTAF
uniref:Uncharacterized protein n=1 Tax=Panagrolaimus sp. JU765 TaxID=591449 RepID=A0AC34RGX0_9BILA